MDRKIYLELCQNVSMLESGIYGIKKDVPNELKVVYDGVVYYPVCYELSFYNGKPTHTAILHDLTTNSVTYADLSKVDKFEEK